MDQHVADLEKKGYTIIPNALSPIEVEATVNAVKEVFAAEAPVWKQLGLQTENLMVVHTIHAKHPLFYEFFLNRPVTQVVRQLIGDDCIMADSNIRVPMPTAARNVRQGFQNHVDSSSYKKDHKKGEKLVAIQRII